MKTLLVVGQARIDVRGVFKRGSLPRSGLSILELTDGQFWRHIPNARRADG